MSQPRTVGISVEHILAAEAAGVTIRRSIGSERLVLLDPILLCDHLIVESRPEHLKQGFPRHPHRGIETLTVVYSGEMAHKDSIGNEDTIGPGDAQWMTAGSGIFHEEMLHTGPDGNQALQLWFNLPASQKMVPPGYRSARAADIPVLPIGTGVTARVIAGTLGRTEGPLSLIAVRPQVFDLAFSSGARVTLDTQPHWTTVVYVVSGNLTIGEDVITGPRLAILTAGSSLTLSADQSAQALFVSAPPLGEPVMQYRSLVLNSVEQMKEAISELENGTFIRS